MVLFTWMVSVPKSISLHFKAHTSPIRIPVLRQMYIPRLRKVKLSVTYCISFFW